MPVVEYKRSQKDYDIMVQAMTKSVLESPAIGAFIDGKSQEEGAKAVTGFVRLLLPEVLKVADEAYKQQ